MMSENHSTEATRGKARRTVYDTRTERGVGRRGSDIKSVIKMGDIPNGDIEKHRDDTHMYPRIVNKL